MREICDVITFEFENLPADAIAYLAEPEAGAARRPGAGDDPGPAHRKKLCRSLGLATAPFFEVSSADAGARGFRTSSAAPGILKTRRLGYDGKGQAKVTSADDAAQAFESFKGAPAILEGFVDFAFEASVVAARGADGAFAAYDPPENIHENHILRRSTVPGAAAARRKATRPRPSPGRSPMRWIMSACWRWNCSCGKDGALLVNEIAPRVHNTGHWTIEACACSQFEQHIRAVAGWPLGDPARHADAVMENIIGAEADAWESLATLGRAASLRQARSQAGPQDGPCDAAETR